MSTSKFGKVVDVEDDPHLSGKEPEEFVENDDEDLDEDSNLEDGKDDDENLDEDVNDDEDTPSEEEIEKEDEVLPRFKGKSKKEINDAYSNLERDHGRLAQEVGELRKLAREWLQLESRDTNDKDKRKAELTEDELLENPSEAINRVVEEKLKPVQKEMEQARIQARMNDFVNKHPDFKDVATSSEFTNWVQASPYRQRLYKQADNLDFDAADELFSIYKDHADVAKKASEKKQADKEKSLRKVSSEKGGSSGSRGKKKVWSSAYLVNLKITNPEKYDALMPEIMEAYNEGRVK